MAWTESPPGPSISDHYNPTIPRLYTHITAGPYDAPTMRPRVLLLPYIQRSLYTNTSGRSVRRGPALGGWILQSTTQP
jgi:hypothetical protein